MVLNESHIRSYSCIFKGFSILLFYYECWVARSPLFRLKLCWSNMIYTKNWIKRLKEEVFMSCGNCDSKNMRLCPFSFGLAIGIVAFLAMFFWSLWVMKYGVPPSMAEHMVVPATFTAALVQSLLCLLKGFLFGFFVALLYDWISCCCRARCCKPGDNGSCDSSDNIKISRPR